MHYQLMRCAAMLALALLVASCAFGDGRGFATVEGHLSVEYGEKKFTTAAGEGGKLTSLTVALVAVQLEGDTEVEGGVEHRTAIIAVAGSWAPLAGTQAFPFGPLEIDRGDYTEIVVTTRRMVFEGEVGDAEFRVEVAPEDGLSVRAPADLAANRDRPPNINLSITLQLPEGLLDGLDPVADPDGARAEIAARIVANGVVQAGWERSED